MTLLGRLYGVRPALRHRVRVRRNVEIPAADGVRLLATHYYPTGRRRPPLVLLRSPYGRGSALDRLPALLAERGYQVLYQSLRGTAGSGGRFDGFVIDPADDDGTLSWLRAHPRFGRNLGTGQPLAIGRDLRVSDHEIFHDRRHPSALWLPLIPGAS
ncbi:CocE/NonD family hydrolase [Streptosporangium sp. NPDC006930]|uniref:CocE/NonD family hydrolase n=1 Tax=unclassified Streptosporangium TaxID=2632669 RepID=UPI00343B5786